MANLPNNSQPNPTLAENIRKLDQLATQNNVLITKVEKIVTEFHQELKKIYGNQLIKIVLYGSHARGDTNEDSDIDIMVIFKTRISAGDEIFRMGAIKNKLNLKYGEMLSVFPISEEDFLFKQTPLLDNIRREGIVW